MYQNNIKTLLQNSQTKTQNTFPCAMLVVHRAVCELKLVFVRSLMKVRWVRHGAVIPRPETVGKEESTPDPDNAGEI